MTSQTDKNLSAEKKLVKQINEMYGDGSIILPELGGEIFNEQVEVIKTGSETINKALGIGGFPRGRIVEILGQEASGKTTLALSVVANAQKDGIRCAFIDAEQAIGRERAEQLGVDFSQLMISQPDDGEQALNILEALVVSGNIGVVVVDSVAALTPRAEIEGDMSDATIGLLARNMGKALRKIVAPANKNGVVVIFINQIRAKLGGFGFFPQETTSGGNALKFYASVRIDMRRTANKAGTTPDYTNHKVTIKKNKFALPMKVVQVRIGKGGFLG